MIKPTGEMREAFYTAAAAQIGCDCPVCVTHRLAAALAIVERDYTLERRKESRPDVGPCCIGYAPCERRPGCNAAEPDRAVELLKYALHLRMHGECAPGGNETWSQFDRDAEAFLRSLPLGGDHA